MGAETPAEGNIHLRLTHENNSMIKYNKVRAWPTYRTVVNFKGIFHDDANEASEYTWRLAGKSDERIRISGTTEVGPIDGGDDIRKASLSFRAPRSFGGRKEWLKFEVLEEGELVHEKYLFINFMN